MWPCQMREVGAKTARWQAHGPVVVGRRAYPDACSGLPLRGKCLLTVASLLSPDAVARQPACIPA
eukprot:11965900-Alexandrium_andersonii.AAC.1